MTITHSPCCPILNVAEIMLLYVINVTLLTVKHTLLPYPYSHFYFDIKFGIRLYSKEKRRAWPLLF